MDRSIETEVVYAIADAEDVEPEELDIVLYDYIDLEPIADLVDDDTTSWTFSFEILSYVVTVNCSGVKPRSFFPWIGRTHPTHPRSDGL